jgi:hypothetical protein
VGSLVADAERSARLGQFDGVDCDVDTWYLAFQRRTTTFKSSRLRACTTRST